MKPFILAFLLHILTLSTGRATELKTFTLPIKLWPELIYSLDVRVGILDPDGPPIGDILYFHGFSDRLDNHGPLFQAWARRGLRVIAFDYPSHGETKGTSLNLFTFKKLAQIAAAVERCTREDKKRPLLVSGWSTGGLLALRMIQSPNFEPLGRRPKGLILFAPGVSVRNFVGHPSLRYPVGEITLDTLTHDPSPPHLGEISPKSPGSTLIFAAFLKLNSLLSQFQKIPIDLPVQIFVAGSEDDRYANSQTVLQWIHWQRQNGANIDAVEMPGARHEIDNESVEFGGPFARELAADFAQSALTSTHSPCEGPLESTPLSP